MKKNNSAVICLSHELDDIDDLSYDSESRLKLAAEIFLKRDSNFFITTGWKYKSSLDNSLSSIMAKFATDKYKIDPEKIFKIEKAKDTVGEAFFLKRDFCSKNNQIRDIYVVTSDWHLKRAKFIFNYFFPPDQGINIIFSTVNGDKNLFLKEGENTSLNKFIEITKLSKTNDLEDFYSKIQQYHDLYKI